ncbi:MAG: transcription termination/antitermination protein NusA [Anaerolineales bacterium]|nr:transcription termination/antitermination protein NusA [Anaerolineales bacterium]
MKNEFFLAFSELLEDKQLPQEIVAEALEAAMVSAYRKTVNASSAQQVEANFDVETGEVTIFAEKEVVEDVQDERTEVDLATAKLADEEAELGQVVMVESTPEDFGRVAAQTARQVIQQRIREAERQAQYDHFKTLEGEIINGIVQAMGSGMITLGLDRKAEGTMPRNHQIRGERFRLHDRVRALLLEVKMSPRGPQIILSRAHKNFLRRLLEDEVPEIYHGLVEIRSIAREPGYRSKVAVAGLQPGIDPVGACVGIRGVRIQAIVRELHDEKIDVIEWNPDPSAFIAKALSPARVSGVFLDETSETKTATVVVPEDQLSLAIGRDGQNARLAAKLTAWRIDIKSLPEATSDALVKLQEQPDLVQGDMSEMVAQVEVVMARKAEGRPITPEEYNLLGRFVNKVETGAEDQRQAEVEEQRARIAEARQGIPAAAFDIPLDELGVSPRLIIKITGEGYSTIGDLMLQLVMDSDQILSIEGVGPKAMEEVREAVEAFEFPEPEIVEEPEEAAEEMAAEAVEAEEELEVEAEAATEAGAEELEEEVSEAAVEEIVEAVEDEEAEEELEEELSFEQALAESEITFIDDDFDDQLLQNDDKGSKKRRKYREVEYDPDLDVNIVRRHRKRKGDEWGEEDWDDFLD